DVRVESLEGRQLLTTTVLLELYGANKLAPPVAVARGSLDDSVLAKLNALGGVNRSQLKESDLAEFTKVQFSKNANKLINPRPTSAGSKFDSAVLTVMKNGVAVERIHLTQLEEKSLVWKQKLGQKTVPADKVGFSFKTIRIEMLPKGPANSNSNKA